MKSRLLIFTIILLLPLQLVNAEPIPEPEQDKPIPENCGIGTELQGGICVANPENEPDTTNGKWGSIDPVNTDERSEFIDFQVSYQAGMPIQFIIENTSYTNCGSFNAKITDNDGNIISEEGVFALCDPPNHILSTYQIKIGYNEDSPIIINKSGTYYLEVEFDNKITKHEFKVRQNTAGGTIDRAVYPTPFSEQSVSIFTHLENNKFPIGNHMYIDFIFLLIIIGVTVIGIVFMIRRKRK